MSDYKKTNKRIVQAGCLFMALPFLLIFVGIGVAIIWAALS